MWCCLYVFLSVHITHWMMNINTTSDVHFAWHWHGGARRDGEQTLHADRDLLFCRLNCSRGRDGQRAGCLPFFETLQRNKQAFLFWTESLYISRLQDEVRTDSSNLLMLTESSWGWDNLCFGFHISWLINNRWNNMYSISTGHTHTQKVKLGLYFLFLGRNSTLNKSINTKMNKNFTISDKCFVSIQNIRKTTIIWMHSCLNMFAAEFQQWFSLFLAHCAAVSPDWADVKLHRCVQTQYHSDNMAPSALVWLHRN